MRWFRSGNRLPRNNVPMIRAYLARAAVDARGLRGQIAVVAAFTGLLMLPYALSLLAASGPRLNWNYAYLTIGLIVAGTVSRAVFVLAGYFLILASLVLQHIGRHWGLGQLDSRLEAFYESPTGETIEYLRSHIDALDAIFVLLAIVLGLALVRYARKAVRLPMALTGLALVSLVVWVGIGALLRMDIPLRRFPPLELARDVFEARQRYAQLSRRAENLKSAAIETSHCSLNYDKVVIVLGESAITDHMSAFGYPKPTTPFVDASRPRKFDALSPANQTRYALAMMLTEATPDAFDRFFQTPSLVAQLRACGMHTLWISNQGRRGRYDSFSTSLAMEADEQVFLNEESWTAVTYDERIVEELERRGDFKRSRQATFVHLIGSHTKYSERYPQGFGFPDILDTVSQYDNSLLYTDHVLAKLYEGFQGESTLFVYVSDHGQMVSNERFGSGFLPGYREEYRTPLLVWNARDEAMARVQHDLGDQKLNLESFDDLVRFLVGMSPEPGISTRGQVAVLSPDYLRDYESLPSFRDAP